MNRASSKGFALPTVLLLLSVGLLLGLPALSDALLQERIAGNARASVIALQSAEAGAAEAVDSLRDESIAWPDPGVYSGAQLTQLTGLPSSPDDAAQHGAGLWWISSVSFTDSTAVITASGSLANTGARRSVRVEYARPYDSVIPLVFTDAIVDCEEDGECDPVDVVTLTESLRPSTLEAFHYSGQGTVNITPANATNGVVGASEVSLTGGIDMVVSGDVVMYVEGDFSLQGQSRLIIEEDSSLVIYIAGQVNAGGGSSIINHNTSPTLTRYNADGSTHQIPSFAIVSAYDASDGINLYGTSEITSIIYAPNTDVSVVGDSRLYGSVYAGSTNVTGGSSVEYDETLYDFLVPGYNPGAEPARLLSWHEWIE
ncbi:pilus assembly PilX family protein [Thioalkalivibrio thiocyanodenitrificans]|uniref:pilus assembly PilX family protein n=1 Tax=Thioalkalivibrio thiocyanodenitrificans TaxID=243063 RepID=UPI0003772C8B|nr:hypothetical protein [Thioalkalivibrio thiocyanodenitrificans]